MEFALALNYLYYVGPCDFIPSQRPTGQDAVTHGDEFQGQKIICVAK